MSTCYERMRKKLDNTGGYYKRLDSYFQALENNKINEYHNKHGRREKTLWQDKD